ncbi:glycoside hydrolase family 10 protein [Boletus edulis]|nr:glycoside hydrolase family 10 protein [Boletus edulis]
MLLLASALFLALVQASVALHTSTSAKATSTVALNTAAKAARKLYFGTATDNPELTDKAYATLLNNTMMFGQLTPGNTMKWYATEPEKNVFNFTGGDQIVAFAKATGKIIRGHNLIWHNQLPDWVTNGSWTPETLAPVIETHVRTEASHYAGKMYSWDVINEPLYDNGTMRANVFYQTLDSSYISIALRAAHAADPKAKLYINDYNLESTGPKIDAMVHLVKNLLAAGVPIHGIGFQGHFILGEVYPSQLQTNMERITALGLEVAVTELDIRIKLPATDADLEQQKADYMSVVQTCVAVSKCVGVTVWDYTDRHSWIPSFFPGYGEACPWDVNLVRKPAYDGIAMAFKNCTV